MKQTAYEILDSPTRAQLERIVLARLLDGWEAQGGIAVMQVGDSYVWALAVVREA